MKPVIDRWNDAEAAGLTGVDLLVYASRLLGADPNLVLWGGGNTSLKVSEPDFRGRETAVLRVKGSGSDLKSVTPRDFPGVRMEDVLATFEREAMSDEEMVKFLAHAMTDPTAPRPSIETLLHAFIPAKCVLHSHADAIVALTDSAEGEAALREVFDGELALIRYLRPGFRLSQMVGEAARANPDLKGVVLMNHGLVTWHDDPREAYRRHIEMVNRASELIGSRESAVGSRISGPDSRPSDSRLPTPDSRREAAVRFAPVLRGMLGRATPEGRVVMRYDGSAETVRFTDWEGAPEATRQGAATPDHILSTKRRPMWVMADEPADLESLASAARAALEEWQADYRAVYEAHSSGEAMLPPVPRVIYVRGVGLFCAWKDDATVTAVADITRHTMGIIEAARALGGYRSLADADAFAAEYWPLELYKLTLAPPEKGLARRVALITGAAGAIGAGIARRFSAEGAHVVCADLDLPRAEALAEELRAAHPKNRALAVRMDVTDETSVRSAYEAAILAYGGVDVLVSNAGFAHNAPIDRLELSDWQRSMDVNATGHFLAAREAVRVMKAQGTGGSLVFIATKNVTSPGKDFGAYSAAKAAEAQLAKVLAVEVGEFGIRSNMVNPDAVFEGSGLWSEQVVAERAKTYGIAPEELPDFYRKRNILRVPVTAADVAEAALYLASDRSAATTGAMIPVDGGLKDAFPR